MIYLETPSAKTGPSFILLSSLKITYNSLHLPTKKLSPLFTLHSLFLCTFFFESVNNQCKKSIFNDFQFFS